MADQEHLSAAFVFKLRGNIALEGDLALAQMELEAFLPGRVQAVPRISQLVSDFPQLGRLGNLLALESFVRPEGVQAFRTVAPLSILPELVRRLSFIQRIYCLVSDSPAICACLAQLEKELGPILAYLVDGDRLLVHALPHYALFELASVVTRRSKRAGEIGGELEAMLEALMSRPTLRRGGLAGARMALAARSTTFHLSHDLHYYKAKFFPRLARSVLNVCGRRLNCDSPQVLDPFVGSGTALLEAAVLKMPAVGLDLDPLSVLISRVKLAVADLEPKLVAQEAAQSVERLAAGRIDDSPIDFPTWLTKNRKMTPEWAAVLGQEINLLRAAVSGCDPQVELLFRVLMSNAIARRVRMRFLGTGVGRFSLTFAKSTAPKIFLRSLQRYAKVSITFEWLKETVGLKLAPTQVMEGDARRLPEGIGRFDIILTSPPYLPASSGRESYAQARALSLITLGMRDAASLDALVDDSVGSMNGQGVELDLLTRQERDLVSWLQNDQLRAIKAQPTARYLLDMGQSLREMYRVLRPGGWAVVVSGKQSAFYNFATRETLYLAPAAEMLAERAQQAGFEVEALHDLQLQKANRNARPRSLDDYYETLIMLRRPD